MVLRFCYEKLRGFCSTCGLLSHDATKCPLNNDALNADPPPDDDEDDDGEDSPHDPSSGVQSPHITPQSFPGEPSEKPAEDYQKGGTENKRRRTSETFGSTSNHQNVTDMRQAFLREEVEDVYVKKRMRLAGEQEMKNWCSWNQARAASTSGSQEDVTTEQPTNREGTVGQKPPEPG